MLFQQIAKEMAKRMLSDDMKIKVRNVAAKYRNREMLQKHAQTQPYQEGAYPTGINLIGDISAETGLGQSMRILASIMENGNIPFCVKQVNLHGQLEHNDISWKHKLVDSPMYAINVINLIPENWASDYCCLDKDILDKRYNIAYWPWELEEFPARWVPCIETVDEIWTPSEFTSNSLRKKTSKPVITVPHIVEAQGHYGRKYFDLPEEKFLFLMIYDFISISERKNPQAVIEAYKKAFPSEEENVGLVIKVNHGDEKKLTQLREQLRNYKNIYFFTTNMTREEVDSLMDNANVLVSLHRSEGFGLPVAEAMSLGKPVISTNWSATAEFTDETCACPVDYRLIKIEKSVGPYEKGNYWADADTSHAASYMRHLWEDEAYVRKIGENAKKYIKENLTYEIAANIVKDRLKR